MEKLRDREGKWMMHPWKHVSQRQTCFAPLAGHSVIEGEVPEGEVQHLRCTVQAQVDGGKMSVEVVGVLEEVENDASHRHAANTALGPVTPLTWEEDVEEGVEGLIDPHRRQVGLITNLTLHRPTKQIPSQGGQSMRQRMEQLDLR